MPGGDLNLDDLLAGINLDPVPSAGTGNKANTAAKKGNNGEKKIKPQFDTIYEGFTVRPLSPSAGEKKTWARAAKTPMPFDGPKLVEMATVFQQKTGRGPASHYRELTPNQQGIIDRVLEERRIEEYDVDAVWELFNVRPIEKEVSKTMWRVERAVVVLEVIICRKDRRKGALVDKPKGSTTNPQRVQGEIIDLNTPLTVKVKKVVEKKKNNNNNRAPELTADDMVDIFGPIEKSQTKGQNDRQPTTHHQHHHQHQHQHQQQQQQQQQQLPPNLDPNRFVWNGDFYEEVQQPLPYPDQHHWDPHFQHDPRFAPQPQHPHHMPPAPMPMRGDQNPFQPHGTHPDQFIDMPQNMDARAQHDPRDYRDRHSRSRSRSRHRQQSRPQSRHHSRRRSHRYSPSMSSSEAEWLSDFTPPSTPPNDEFLMSAGAFQRRKGQRYYREKRTPYRDERAEIHPGVSYRIDYVEDLDRLPLRPRPILVHDDYPRQKRRIADFAETIEDADFIRNRPRDRGMDMLREEGRARRHEERRFEPRRFTSY